MKHTRAELIEDICQTVGIVDRQRRHYGYLRRIDLQTIAGWIRGKGGMRSEVQDDSRQVED
jgi:hypothetical protein